MVADWIGDSGIIKKININNLARFFPYKDLTCKGIVTKKYIENSENYVECEFWLED